MYKDVLNTLQKKILPLENTELSDELRRIEEAVSAEGMNGVLFVSAKDGLREVAGLIKQLCGDLDELESPDFYSDSLPLILKVKRNNSEAVEMLEKPIVPEINKYREITLYSDSEAIGEGEICYCCGLELSHLDAVKTTGYDRVVLFTNAVMAMTASEKSWLENTVEAYFGSDRAAVVLFNSTMLNTEEDYETVCSSAERVLAKVAPEAEFYKSSADFLDGADGFFAFSDELIEKRRAATVRAGLAVIEGIIKKTLYEKSVDSDKLQRLVRKIGQERKYITASSVVAVYSKTEALYSELKTVLCDAADAFVDDAYKSITDRISKTNQLEADIQLVPSYLQKVLKVFEDKSQDKIIEEHMKIAEKLDSQLDEDCKALVELVDISRDSNEIGKNDFAGLDINSSTRRYDFNDVEEINNYRRTSRGMISASTIGTILFSPFLGGTVILGKYLYEKYSNTSRNNAVRKSFLEQLEADREELKLKLDGMICEKLSELKEETSGKVSETYKEVINDIADALVGHLERSEKIESEKELLGELLSFIEEADILS